MRNQSRMLKLIEELLAKATNKITAEYREEQLKAIKIELAAKETDLDALEAAEKGQVYNDDSAREYINTRKKNLGDILIPACKAEAESLVSQIGSNDTALERYEELQLTELRRIEDLKVEIGILSADAKNHTGDFQLKINDQITDKVSAMGDSEQLLKVYAEKLISLILNKAELGAKLQGNKKHNEELEQELAILSKDSKPVSIKKVIAETGIEELKAQIADLKRRKKILSTAIPALVDSLTSAVKAGATDSEIAENLSILKILAGESAIDLNTTPKVGFVAVPLEPTVGMLKDQQRFSVANTSVLQQNAINNTVSISQMVAGIVYYMELINKAKIVREHLQKELIISEKELTKLPDIRRKIKTVEDMIITLEVSKNDIFKKLESIIIYNRENAVKQGLSSFIGSKATTGLSQLESKTTNPFETTLSNLEIMSTLLAAEYQMPVDSEEVIESDLAAGEFLEDLSGEKYNLESEKSAPSASYAQTPDLTMFNPNSFTKEPIEELETEEKPVEASEQYIAPTPIPEPAALPSTDVEPNNTFDLMAAYAKTTAAKVEEEEPAMPVPEPVVVPPISTEENPIFPASVTDYERKVETGEIKPEKLIMPFPVPEVIDTKPVNINNLKALKAKGVRYLKTFFAQPYAFPEEADTERGLRVG